MLRPLTSSCHDVFVKPVELSFCRNRSGSFCPAEILLINRAQKPLFYKILCTARMSYRLSKCKGTLNAGEFIKISVELDSAVPEENRRDYFKLQFFDQLRSCLISERIVTSCIWLGQATPPLRTPDSESGNSVSSHGTNNANMWSSAKNVECPFTDSKVPSDSFESIPVSYSTHFEPKSNPKSALKLRSSLAIRKKNLAVLPAHADRLTVLPSGTDLVHQLRTILCLIVFAVCLTGICLPFFVDDLQSLLLSFSPQARLFSWGKSAPVADLNPVCPSVDHSADVPSEELGHQLKFCHKSSDEFSKHRRMAAHHLKVGLQSIWVAARSVNPLNVIANLSWFFLGMLLMYVYLQ